MDVFRVSVLGSREIAIHRTIIERKYSMTPLTHYCTRVPKIENSQERLVITPGVESDISIRTNEPQGFFTSRARPSVDSRRQLVVSDFSDAPYGRPLYMELPKPFLGNKVHRNA